MPKKSTRFPKLSDPKEKRKLHAHESIREHGIVYTRMPNGDGVYSVNIMVDGERIHRVAGRESQGWHLPQVQVRLEQYRSEAREGRLALPRGRKIAMRFADAAERYLDRLMQEGGKDVPAKRRRVALHLMKHFGKVPLSAIGAADIERYKQMRLAETAIRGGQRVKPKDESKLGTTRPGTINRELAVLSHLLHKAVEWSWISHVPVKVTPLPDDAGRIDYLTVEECQRLLGCAKADDNDQIFAFILIGLESSMRRGEILRIRREDLDLPGRTIFIPKAKAGARKQPITGRLAGFLESYVAALPADTPWLFPSATSITGHTMDVRKAFRRAVIAAGLDPVKVVRHTLRHTAITHIVQAGVDLPTVKKFSGHKTLAMVERYSHTNAAHLLASVDKLEERYKKVA